MIRFFFLVLLSFVSISVLSQNTTKFDQKINRNILHGKVTLEAFEGDICKNWYGPEYKAYIPKKGIIKKLRKQSFDDIRITLILGTWCHDSHREVPHLIKILDEVRFPFSNLTMNALDTKKQSPDFDTRQNDVSRVPTAIVYRNGNEIGRIIETPQKSLEKDILKILSKK